MTTPERQRQHQNASHFKADTEVYFVHISTGNFFWMYATVFIMGNDINLKRKLKKIQHFQPQSSQATHLRPRSDYTVTVHRVKILFFSPHKKNLPLLHKDLQIQKINSGDKRSDFPRAIK